MLPPATGGTSCTCRALLSRRGAGRPRTLMATHNHRPHVMWRISRLDKSHVLGLLKPQSPPPPPSPTLPFPHVDFSSPSPFFLKSLRFPPPPPPFYILFFFAFLFLILLICSSSPSKFLLLFQFLTHLVDPPSPHSRSLHPSPGSDGSLFSNTLSFHLGTRSSK